MSADILLANGMVLRGGELVKGCVAFRGGRIWYVGDGKSAPMARERIDLCGNLIFPGLIDAHVHLRDMGQAYKEDFLTGTRSALAGGFTTVLDMPSSVPPTDNPEGLRQKLEVASSKIVANAGFYGAFDGDLKHVKEMADLGVVGFKVFMIRRGPLNGDDDGSLEKALLSAKHVGLPVAFHAEDLKTIERLEAEQKVSKCSSLCIFAKTHPPEAEGIAIKRLMTLVEKTKATAHVCHLSTSEGLENIKSAKEKGLRISCEVGPHHLFLSWDEVHRQGGIAIVDPPLRERGDQRSLLQGLVNGEVDFVASDHAPHSLSEKTPRGIWSIPPGFPGLEATLPVMLTAVRNGRLTLARLEEILAKEPARVFGLGSKGHLLKGYDADVTVIDLNRNFVIDPDQFQSKAKYSPFEGFKATGMAVKAFVGGRLAMDDGRILAEPGSGALFLRK